MQAQRIPAHMSPHSPQYQNTRRPRMNINPYRERQIPQVQYGQQQVQIPNHYRQEFQSYRNPPREQYGQRFNSPQYQPPPTQRYQTQNQNYDGLPMRPGSKGQYILFYSTYCGNCNEFLNILCKRQDIYERFKMINISAPNSPKPGFLRHVPTIVVPGVDRPLAGEEVFQWLENQADEQAKKGETKEGIQPYLPNEMGMGMGNDYSYIDIGDTDQPMEHSFVFISRPEEKIRTPDEKDFVNAKPPRVQGVDMSNRPPLMQGVQHSALPPPSKMPSSIIPQSSGSLSEDKEDVSRAYDELRKRREMDMTQMQPPQNH